MKILIIGSEGFIGSHCVAYFKSIGYDVFEANLSKNTSENCFTIDRSNSNFSEPFQNHKFDVCINASGSAHVGFSFENPSIDYELNVVNVQKILVCIRNFNPSCKFINFSSAAVYGNPKSLPIKENSICKPMSPYGFHKLQSELLLTEYHNFFGLKTCSLRVFSAYGPGLKKQLFWDLYQKTLQDDTIKLYGTGLETRDFIYIDDLIQIIDLVIEKSSFDGAIYNVANNKETTIDRVAQVFKNELSPEKKVLFNGEVRLGDPNNWLADISKLKKMGYIQKVNIIDGLKNYVKWLEE